MMNLIIDEKIKSVLHMEELFFKNISFVRKQSILDTENGKIDFKVKHIIEENILEVNLISNILVDDFFSLDIELYGKFSVEGNDILVENLLPNAIAIMFPFLRSQVTLISSQPSFKPIIIPAININKLLYEKGKNDNSRQLSED